MEALEEQAAALDAQLERLKGQRAAPIQATPFTPRLKGQSERDRRRMRTAGISLAGWVNRSVGVTGPRGFNRDLQADLLQIRSIHPVRLRR